MKKYKFIKVIPFIFILLLFFAQSAYDPSVYAKMRKMEDDNLSDITAEALFTDLNINVRAVATSMRLTNENDANEYINISNIEIGNGTAGTGFVTNTSMAWDIGEINNVTVTDVWLMGHNVTFPKTDLNGANYTGMGLFAYDILMHDSATPTYNAVLGNLVMTGFSFGQNVINTYANLQPYNTTYANASARPVEFSVPWIIISSEGTASAGRGLVAYGEVGGFIDYTKLTWNSAGAGLTMSGVYIYGMMNETAPYRAWTDGAAGWDSTRRGMTSIGGDYPIYANPYDSAPTGGSQAAYASADIGYSSNAARNGGIRLDFPFAGSIRIREVRFGDAGTSGTTTTGWGPFAIDDIVAYTNRITFQDVL